MDINFEHRMDKRGTVHIVERVRYAIKSGATGLGIGTVPFTLCGIEVAKLHGEFWNTPKPDCKKCVTLARDIRAGKKIVTLAVPATADALSRKRELEKLPPPPSEFEFPEKPKPEYCGERAEPFESDSKSPQESTIDSEWLLERYRQGPAVQKGYQIGADSHALRSQAGKKVIIGFDSIANVPAGSMVFVRETVHDACKGERLIVPHSIAHAFMINDIRIGNMSQFSSATGVPAEAFVPEARSPCLTDIAQIDQQISIVVTNRSGSNMRFLAAMFGRAVC